MIDTDALSIVLYDEFIECLIHKIHSLKIFKTIPEYKQFILIIAKIMFTFKPLNLRKPLARTHRTQSAVSQCCLPHAITV